MKLKRVHILIVVLIITIFLWGIVIKNDFMNTLHGFRQYISQDLLFWTFSTIVQSFVAFLALLGMVAIYRIQIFRRNIETLAGAMRNHLKQHRGSEVDGYTTEKIIKDTKGLAGNRPDMEILKRASLEFSNLEKYINDIKERTIEFFYFIIFLLVFSLVFLFMSPVLEYTLFGLLVLWLIIFWCLASFILGLNLLKGLI